MDVLVFSFFVEDSCCKTHIFPCFYRLLSYCQPHGKVIWEWTKNLSRYFNVADIWKKNMLRVNHTHALHSMLDITYSALHSLLHPWRSKLYTLHFTLHKSNSTMHIPHLTFHTPQSSLHTTPYTLQSTLRTPHFTLYTHHSLFVLYASHSALCTSPTPQFTLVREQGKHVPDCWNIIYLHWFRKSVYSDCIRVW